MSIRTRHLIAIAIGVTFLAGSPLTEAQSYPTKAIRYIVPFAPGGGVDALARVTAAGLNAAWGEAVVVENRPGAGGNLATEFVGRSAPDGYTLLMTTNSHSYNASLYSKLGYDPIKDFAPLSLIATSPNILVAHPSLPVRTVRELIVLAKSRPDQLTYGSGGVGGGSHLAGELFNSMANVKLVHIAYKGIAPAVVELMGGHVSLAFAVAPVVYAQVRAGKLRALGVTSAERSAFVPELPTVSESGLSGYDVFSWYGSFAPAGTPSAVISKLNGEIVKLLQMPDVKQKLAAIGLEIKASSPEEFGKFVKADWAIWDKIIKNAGIRITP